MADIDTILDNTIVFETKYHTMCRLIENASYHTYVDLPWGYTPKSFYLTKKNLSFVGLNFSIVMQKFVAIILSLATNPEHDGKHDDAF